MGGRDINLDGGEVAVIKAIGTGGTEVTGEDIIARCVELEGAELVDTLKSLIMLGYVTADSTSFHSGDDLRGITFRVNSGYAKDLREALSPQKSQVKSKRVRRE